MVHLVGRIVSGVPVSASFQIIPRLVGRLGSEIRDSVSLQSSDLRMFVLSCLRHPVCHPLCQKGHLSVPLVLSCFRETQ